MIEPERGGRDGAADYIDSAAGLRGLCKHLASVERFGVDTEFVGERTYVPQLELIQVATPERTALIDCRAVTVLSPFFDVLLDEKIEKVLHAGQQDLELFGTLTGRVPSPIVDTQVAAAMAGLGAQVGYAQLVERLLGVSVEKSETLTDWSRRPLTQAQIAYALDDVGYILPLYERLRERLTELHRWEWLREECKRLEQATRVAPVEPNDAFLRVRGRGSLRAKGLAVLRELAAWREEVARERNRPRATIVRDEALVEIARKAPTSVAALRGLRAVRSREVDRHAGAVVERVVRALEQPKDCWPQPAPSHGAAPSAGLVELLQTVLRLRSEEASIAPSLVATQAELQQLVQQREAGDAAGLPILQGWREAIAGKDLLALLEGRASVTWNPQRRSVEVRISDSKRR
jgi:ribonuclease D